MSTTQHSNEASDDVEATEPRPGADLWLSKSCRYWGNLFSQVRSLDLFDCIHKNVSITSVPSYGRNLEPLKDPQRSSEPGLLWTEATIEWYLVATVAGIVQPNALTTCHILLGIEPSSTSKIFAGNDFPASPLQFATALHSSGSDYLVERIVSRESLSEAVASNMVAMFSGMIASHGDNHLTMLSLAWAYIVSAIWAEMQGGSIVYNDLETNSVPAASFVDPLPSHVQQKAIVYLGSQSEDALKWWHAVLAGCGGWEASIKKDGSRYVSPWSVRLSKKFPRFVIVTNPTEHPATEHSNLSPPSPRRALEFLRSYCNMHGLHDQSRTALHACLIFPTHSLCGISIRLPNPYHAIDCLLGSHPSKDDSILLDLMTSIPHLMTVSAAGVIPILSASLYDPDVPVTFSGEWLEPVWHSWPTIAVDAVKAFSRRTPSLSPWLAGAGVTSLVSRKNFRHFFGGGMWKTRLEIFAWTGAFHSHWCSLLSRETMLHTSGELEKSVAREQEALMLVLTSGRASKGTLTPIPQVPWKPSGWVTLSKSSLDVIRAVEARVAISLVYSRTIWANGEDEYDIQSDIRHTAQLLESSQESSRDQVSKLLCWLAETRGHEADEPNDMNDADSFSGAGSHVHLLASISPPTHTPANSMDNAFGDEIE